MNPQRHDVYQSFTDLLADATLEANKMRVARTGGAAFAEERRLQEHAEKLAKMKEALQSASEALEKTKEEKSGWEKALEAAEKLKTGVDRLGEWSMGVKDFLVAHEELLGPLDRGVKFASTLVKVEQKSFEIADIQRMRLEINDSMGNQARDLSGIRKRYELAMKEYQEEYRKLEALLPK